MNPNSDFDITMPYIIASVVFSFYKSILSISWTPDRYLAYLDSVKLSLIAAQNRNPYIIFNSLRLIRTYMINMDEEKLELEPEYCIFVAAFRIGQKFNDDFYCTQFEIDSSILTKMSSLQLKQFEFKFLDKINYAISMTKEEYFIWKDQCLKIYVTVITPTILDNDVDHYQEISFMGLLNNININYCLYNGNYNGTTGIPSPPSSVISKNEFYFEENALFLNLNTNF